MKSSKTFNNISEKLKAEIPKLKPGERAVFKMLNGVPNIEPDEKERSKDPILYPKVQLITQFRIYDPYQNPSKDAENGFEGGYVDVGCVAAGGWDGDKPIKIRSFVAGVKEGAQTPSRFQGKFELVGGNIMDEELYEILWLSPQRKGSPCPDSSVEVIFELQDVNSESKGLLRKYDILKKALDLSGGITEEKATEVMSALNQPTYQDKPVLMAKIKELASTDPELFIKVYESSETPVIYEVKKALANLTITHDAKTGDVKMGSVTITTIKTLSTDEFIDQFAKWLMTSANGKDVLKSIKEGGKKTVDARK